MAVEDPCVLKRAELRVVGAVARAVLIGAVVSIAGCIIPTPLSQQHPTVNSPPKILTDQVMPTFNSEIVETQSALFTFSIAASDADLGDVLLARLLFSTEDGPPHYVDQITLAPQASEPEVRSGQFGEPSGRAYCAFLSGNVGVYVAVTDSSFSNGDTDATGDNDSDRDEIFWRMTCGN